MDKYNDYLAAHVLNEHEIVTYRTLSRALKVHVNLAKQMLWDFHKRQNAKKPGSAHATYLISGTRRSKASTSRPSTQEKSGVDVVMASSPPFPSSSMPVIEGEEGEQTTLSRALLLVREEDVETAKATFSEIRGIHVYSVQAQGLSDFRSLTACTKQVYKLLREEDPMKNGAQYGQIRNVHARRRTQKTPLPPPPVDRPATQKSAVPQAKTIKTEPTKTAPAKTATLKREGSSIAASFAKTSAKPKAKPQEEKPAVKDDDTPMAGFSDDDDDDDVDDGLEIDIDVKGASGKSKFDRQAELEAMMDIDDDGVADGLEQKDKDEQDMKGQEEEQDAQDLDPPPPEPVQQQPKETVTVENGRRRGRRRVMKKKTVRDADGYLVTKEEAVWESFSEDEPVFKKAKTTTAPAPAPKKGAKPGQGNIRSFFTKK